MNPREFRLIIECHPATQGSKKAFLRGKKIVMVEMDAKLPAWRKAIVAEAGKLLGPDWIPMDGALEAILTVYLPRPKSSIFGDYPAGPPDLDKLQRAIGDALTIAKAIHDDARIVHWDATKLWATEARPIGAVVSVRPILPVTRYTR